MGKRTPTSPDEAKSIITGSFPGTGVSASSAFFPGGINIVITGTFTATVKVRRSFDGGITWVFLDSDLNGTDLTFTAPGNVIAEEVESAALWSLECTAFTSGTINYRVSQG